MAQEFRLPDIGEGLTQGEVVQWLVELGDPVAIDQPIVELETDKAVTEIPSPFAGVVLYQGGAVGSTIEVGQTLVVIGYAGEEWAPPAADEPSEQVAPIVGTLSERAELLGATAGPAGAEADRPKALPLVRRLAKEHGIDLEDVSGSGPHGRITREDVLAAVEGPTTGAARAMAAPPDEGDESTLMEEETAHDGEQDRQRMTRLRRTIAERMSRSWAEIPHVTAFEAADANRLLAARRALARRSDSDMPIEALLVKAILPALVAFPEFNSSLDGEELVLKRYYNIGVAVDTDDGLIVPVVHEADTRGIADLAAQIMRLAGAARERTLAPSDLAGATFTVSNIGAVGGGYGTPIVPYGTTAILSVGRAEEQAVVREGKVVVTSRLPLSLSYDHRVIDGGMGRRFLAMVTENLEEPALFLAE